MKYLKLYFYNAGFFTNPKNKDFVFDLNVYRKREDNNQKVSISVNQISNMMHVLLGERPSATYRDTIFKQIPEIRKFAEDSYIKITTMMHEKKDGSKYYGRELIQLRKGVPNSYPTSPTTVYWKRIENLLTDSKDNSLYIELINLLESKLDRVVTNELCKNVIIEFNEKFKNDIEFNNYKEKIKKEQKMPLYAFLNCNFDDFTFCMNSRTRITNNIGIDDITRVSGKIIIPIDDNGIVKIKQSKGCATLLDGGVVFIVDLCDEEDLTMDELSEYIKINELEAYENNI